MKASLARPSVTITCAIAVSTATLVAIQTACSNDFEGAGVGPAAPQPATQVSPKEADTNGETSKPTTPTPPAEVCSLENKAARIYFVVDNSNSHGYVVEGEALRRGTDPARKAVSVRGQEEWRTYRQEALYTISKRAIELDRKAKENKPDFLGTEIGLAYFPKYRGSGNPSVDPGTLEDLAQYVHISGENGVGENVFSKRMMPLSDISGDLSSRGELSDELWSAFNFTHSPGGSTPYATGLRAAVENFVPGLEQDDPRQQLVILLTDGLPTDETPSAVRALRQQLGESTKFLMIAVYDPNEDPAITNSPLYKNLQKAFLGPQSWGTKPSNPDKYPKTVEGFARYWADLLAIPEAIADTVVRVAKASDLTSTIEGVLTSNTTCRAE